MKERWTAVNVRTVVLVSSLGSLGLLVSAEAGAMTPSEARRSKVTLAAVAGGERATAHAGANRGRAGVMGRRQKRTRGNEAGAKGKRRSPPPGRARSESVACVAAFDKAKEIAQGPQLRAANEWFAVCARPVCGRSLRTRCAAVHDRIAALLPSIVPVVTDADGAAASDVQVRMDGEILTPNANGSAIVVDPGSHDFTFAKDGEIFATRSLTLEKGERNRIVAVVLRPRKPEPIEAPPPPVAEPRTVAPSLRRIAAGDAAADGEPADEDAAPRLVMRARSRRAPAEAETRTGNPWSAYALAGVAVLGAGGYAVFNLKGSANNDALVAFCKPDCNPTSVRHVRNLYLAADISLGIGVAALIGSTYLFLRSDSAEQESPRARSTHISGLSVAPTTSGALATVGGTF